MNVIPEVLRLYVLRWKKNVEVSPSLLAVGVEIVIWAQHVEGGARPLRSFLNKIRYPFTAGLTETIFSRPLAEPDLNPQTSALLQGASKLCMSISSKHILSSIHALELICFHNTYS